MGGEFTPVYRAREGELSPLEVAQLQAPPPVQLKGEKRKARGKGSKAVELMMGLSDDMIGALDSI